MAVARRHWSSDIICLAYLFSVRHSSDSSVLSRHFLSLLLNSWASRRAVCFILVAMVCLLMPPLPLLLLVVRGASDDWALVAADDDNDGVVVSSTSVVVDMVGVVARDVSPLVDAVGDSGIVMIASFLAIAGTGGGIWCVCR